MSLGHVNQAMSMQSLSTVGHVGPTYILREPNRSGRFVGRGYVPDGHRRFLLRHLGIHLMEDAGTQRNMNSGKPRSNFLLRGFASPRERSFFPALVLILAFAMVGNAQAHRMNHTVSHDQAVVVSLSYPYGHPPAYETYRVYAPDEELVFKNGRTDAQGRLSFSPDRAGAWRVVVSTDDGHGVDLEIEVSEEMVIAEISGPGHSHFGMIVAGVGYLFGLAGALVLWRQRSRQSRPG